MNHRVINGYVWRAGSGDPTNDTGLDGDIYLQTGNGDVYQKSNGAYAVILNLVGQRSGDSFPSVKFEPLDKGSKSLYDVVVSKG